MENKLTVTTRAAGASRFGVLLGVLVVAALVLCGAALWLTDSTGRKGNLLTKEFDYDLGELRRTDPDLILYEQISTVIKTGFDNARDMVLGNDDRIYVAGDRAVGVFADDGSLVQKHELANEPYCLAVADEGTLYIGMRDHVEVYNSEGTRLASWQAIEGRAILTSMALAKNDIFIADAGNRVVWHYGRDGNLVGQIGKKDPSRNISGFVVPSPYFDLAMAPDGLLRVVNPGRHRIEAYTTTGDLEFSWGSFGSDVAGFCGCCNPVSFALLDDEGFVTAEKGLTRVKVYSAEGEFAGVVAGPESFVEHDRIRESRGDGGESASGFDVAVDGQGRILVLDPATGEIRLFVRSAEKP